MSTREELIGAVDRYLEALGRNDPSRLPLSPNVRFTENCQALPLGKGLWATATPFEVARPHFVDVVEPAAGQIACFAVVREEDRPAILSLRLRVDPSTLRPGSGQAGSGRAVISEVETLVARQPADGRFRVFNPDELLQPRAAFQETLAPAERAPRAEMVRLAHLYFDGVVSGKGDIIPALPGCIRIENGVQTVLNTEGQSETMKLGVVDQVNTGIFRDIEAARERRFPVVDEEKGLIFAVFFWDHPGPVTAAAFTSRYREPNSMMVAEIFKIKSRRFHHIEAVLNVFPYGTRSGWD